MKPHFGSQNGSKIAPKFLKNSSKMASRWHQDGPKMASWRVLGPKMEPRGSEARKKRFFTFFWSHVGPMLGAKFRHFNYKNGLEEASKPSWITCCVKTPIFKRKWASRDPFWTWKIKQIHWRVVKIQGFRFSFESRSWKPSWGGFWSDFGPQVEAKLGHVGH